MLEYFSLYFVKLLVEMENYFRILKYLDLEKYVSCIINWVHFGKNKDIL